ncbi:hypothetical protein [Streptomyces viridochromogenes]|uniref:Oxidoreductase n=1 Tax=Streptomyces viridochromogenes Tue57 TaxID=1160705 RepID=L8PNS7_STRVR|nr:hypothetical protein [Streptomyces viridochromogenes]ELS57683.1 hypothetical protein STVIR_1421 [Streptomyces viridochromogenes Tue57]
MSNSFRLGGDLDVNRRGFGAMRLPAKAGIALTPSEKDLADLA